MRILNNKLKKNILEIILFVKKNLVIIVLITCLFLILGGYYIFKNNTYTVKIQVLSDTETFKELNLPITSAFEMEEFNDYLQKNLKKDYFLKKDRKKEDYKLNSSINFFYVENSPKVEISYSNKSKEIVKMFPIEFLNLSNAFFKKKKNEILGNQISVMQKEYDKLIKNHLNFETASISDPELTSSIMKLAYWRYLKEEKTPMITLVKTDVYPTLNKKIIFIFLFFLGIFFGVFFALLKEVIKELKSFELIVERR